MGSYIPSGALHLIMSLTVLSMYKPHFCAMPSAVIIPYMIPSRTTGSFLMLCSFISSDALSISSSGSMTTRGSDIIVETLVFDALTPFAVIEDGKIVNWKTSAPGSTAKTGGGGSAGAKPAGVPSPTTPPDPTVVQYINKDGEPKTKKFATKEDADEFYRKWSAGGGKFWRRSGNELIVN